MPLSPLQQLLALRLHDRNPETERDPSAIEASVALIIGSDPDTVLIIRRAERVGDPWSGHMGLPGGRRSQKDEHLLATAIRETEEEVGLTLTPGNLLGTLNDVAPRSEARSPIFARPHVFGIEGHPPLQPNHEVSLARWVPLQEIIAPERRREFSLEIGGVARSFPAYHLDEGTVWGMTERMLTSVIQLLEDPLP